MLLLGANVRIKRITFITVWVGSRILVSSFSTANALVLLKD